MKPDVAAALREASSAEVEVSEPHTPNLVVSWRGWSRAGGGGPLCGSMVMPRPVDASHLARMLARDADPVLVTFSSEPDDPVYADKGEVWFPGLKEAGGQSLASLLDEGPDFVAPRAAFVALVDALGLPFPRWLESRG